MRRTFPGLYSCSSLRLPQYSRDPAGFSFVHMPVPKCPVPDADERLHAVSRWSGQRDIESVWVFHVSCAIYQAQTLGVSVFVSLCSYQVLVLRVCEPKWFPGALRRICLFACALPALPISFEFPTVFFVESIVVPSVQFRVWNVEGKEMSRGRCRRSRGERREGRWRGEEI